MKRAPWCTFFFPRLIIVKSTITKTMKNLRFLILITSIAALGGFLFGYDTGVINGAQYYLSQFFKLDPFTKGWVVGSALLGCLGGAIFSGIIGKFLGRKNSLILSALLFTISAYGSGLPEWMPQSVSLLVVFRVVGGLGIGLASMNAPLYIAELAPPSKRGFLVTFYQLAIVVGFFVVFLVTYLIGDQQSVELNIARGWRQMFWSELIPSILFFFLLFLLPKSPRWLFLKGRSNEANIVLNRLFTKESAAKQSKEITESISKDNSGKVRITKSVLFLIVIGSVLSGLQQLTGINAVLYYGADIFEKALGFGKDDVLQQQIILAGVNLIFTFVAMFTVDRIGRKPLLYIGSFGMIAGFLLLGISIKTSSIGLASLFGILIFIASFALSLGPVVWVVLSEIFPNNIRTFAMSTAVAVQWGMNYLVSQLFPVVVESDINNNEMWNGSLPYFIFIFFIMVIIGFTFRFIPETKGKSLEDLEKNWSKQNINEKTN